MSIEKSRNQKKIRLAKKNKQTRWAPVWVVLKKMGKGKKSHPSAVTHVKRSWRQTKLKIKPRHQRKQHLG
jgi:ribosomal protein L39E